MTVVRHYDEAMLRARAATIGWQSETGSTNRLLLVDDLIGRLSLVVWPPAPKRPTQSLVSALAEAAGPFWSGSVQRIASEEEAAWEALWSGGRSFEGAPDNVKILERVHGHLHWFDPPKPLERAHTRPRTIAFLSFKGGVGRTTALAAFAIQRARFGEHVAVVDLDLDAPGVGALLSDEEPREQAPYGVVDFLIEAPWISDLDLNDYVHRCARPKVSERGSIVVVPAGTLDESYLAKMARAELNATTDGPASAHGIPALLSKLSSMADQPDWILIDGRAGLSEAAGLLLSGIADLHMIVATASEQSFGGLTLMIDHLGARRLRSSADAVQAEVLVVQSMIPDNTIVAQQVEARFSERLEEIFRDHYYAKDADAEEDRWWSLADLEAPEAPHRPIVIGYKGRLASFERIDDIANDLTTEPDYLSLGARIIGSFGARAVARDNDHDNATDE